jgi:hypothetical protein
VDWSIELTNPLSEYDFLIKKNGDSFIIWLIRLFFCVGW